MNITIAPAKKPMNFQYWSVAKINKEMFYEVVAHKKKKVQNCEARSN